MASIINHEIIDVHLHNFTGLDHADAVMRDIEYLHGKGVSHLVVIGSVNLHLDAEVAWNLVPPFIENRGNERLHDMDDLLELARIANGVILPLVDTRYLSGDLPATLRHYIGKGAKGIKGVYLADEHNDLRIGNVPAALGITLEQYLRREWEVFAFAEENDLPLLYHMDSRRYGDVMEALLKDFPRVRVNFPHFGIGRKAFSSFMDRYPNIFTDFAGMITHIRSAPDSYRDFINHYSDRVCFASDVCLYQAAASADYIEMVRELRLPEDVEHRVFTENPRRFLGSAINQTG